MLAERVANHPPHTTPACLAQHFQFTSNDRNSRTLVASSAVKLVSFTLYLPYQREGIIPFSRTPRIPLVDTNCLSTLRLELTQFHAPPSHIEVVEFHGVATVGLFKGRSEEHTSELQSPW